jgi:hypothetical protein
MTEQTGTGRSNAVIQKQIPRFPLVSRNPQNKIAMTGMKEFSDSVIAEKPFGIHLKAKLLSGRREVMPSSSNTMDPFASREWFQVATYWNFN